jgi:hypothetical protein
MLKRIVIIGTLVALAVPAFAADAHKVDFTTPVVVDGKPQIDEFKCPLKDGKRECETPFTVGELAYFSLERPVQNQSWSDAIKHDDLARAVRTAKDFPLLDDQKIMIENAMGPLWSPSVLGFVKTVIEPATEAQPK